MIKTMFHIISTSNPLTIILNILFLIYYIILIIKFRNKKLLYFMPLIISLIHLIIFVSGSAFLEILPAYKNIYIVAILIMISPLLSKKKLVNNISTTIIIITCAMLSLSSMNSTKITNFTRKSLSNSYISLCNYLEKNYIMNDWKKIDYKKIKNEGLKKVQEAEQNGNINKYYDALDDLTNEFHDGHMGISFYTENYSENQYLINKLKEYNDYGLSLVTLDDGATIAVDVEETLEIKNGDIITKWDGVPIEEAIKNVKIPMKTGVLENEKIVKTFFLAGIGDDTVSVSYIKDNEEVTINLNKIESEIPRALKSLSTFNHTHNNEKYNYKMLNDNIGYLRVGIEEIDTISDNIGYLTGNHKVAREKFRKSLQELRKNGMKKLIIDIRNNGGGYDEVSTALASLFTNEKIYAYSLGYRSNNKNISLVDRYILPDGEFSDIEVLVLTNMRCASAGDGMVLYLSKINNVKIAGLTSPEGINQETGGTIFMPKGIAINYPIGLVLDQNNNPNIDIDYTRKTRTPLDIKIPVDKEGILKLFNGEDYELEWAINYLK